MFFCSLRFTNDLENSLVCVSLEDYLLISLIAPFFLICLSQDTNYQTHQQTQSPPLQHVISLPVSNLMSTRVTSSLQRGASAYRSSLQSSSNTRTSATPTNIRNPQASLIMSGSLRTNTVLPLGVTRELARQVAQQKSQLQAGASNPLASRIPTPSTANLSSPRLSVGEPSRDAVDVQLDKNWRPTGRMRGSLTGVAYSAALSQYASLTTPTNTARPLAPSVIRSTPNPLPRSTGNVNAQGPTAEHATEHIDLDGQSESSS